MSQKSRTCGTPVPKPGKRFVLTVEYTVDPCSDRKVTLAQERADAKEYLPLADFFGTCEINRIHVAPFKPVGSGE